ncbi:MAG: PHP domain-containing protein [Clostridia bacterium]|nr:PHP domain-containing protein [Clostridia bacterium]
MRFQIEHDLHIHSHLSLCSGDPEQSNERILAYAKENGFHTVCLTNHFWDERIPVEAGFYKQQDFPHIAQARPLPQAEGIRFLFGCEGEMNTEMTIGISKERWDEFDFIIVPTTHLHMDIALDAEKDGSIERRAQLWVKRLDALLDSGLPFYKLGVAHLTTRLIDATVSGNHIKVLNKIPDAELFRLFEKAAQRGCGIELNAEDMKFTSEAEDAVLRIYRVAKECGCKFYCGSDAHRPAGLDEAKALFEKAVTLLALSEDDKFYPNGK